jgi:hypothetical protein
MFAFIQDAFTSTYMDDSASGPVFPAPGEFARHPTKYSNYNGFLHPSKYSSWQRKILHPAMARRMKRKIT